MRSWSRIISAILALLWLGLLCYGNGVAGLLHGVLALALPLSCIWFPDLMGSILTNFPSLLSNVPITEESPGWVVRICGWLLLIVITLIAPLIIWMVHAGLW